MGGGRGPGSAGDLWPVGEWAGGMGDEEGAEVGNFEVASKQSL